MKKVLGLVMIMVFAFSALANPFSDVPFSHWAYDAVAKLSAKGIITGFPDGTFKGSKKVTRYELAMIVARLMAKMDSGVSMPGMSSDDRKTVEKLTVELADELSLLGVKVTALEDEVAVLKDDVAMIKDGGYAAAPGGGGNVAFSGEYHLDFFRIEDDDVTIYNGIRNHFKNSFTYRPTVDTVMHLEYDYRVYDWDTAAGGDYTLGAGNGELEQAYLKIKDFDLFGLAQFDNAVFGRKRQTLAKGLLIDDAKKTGIKFNAEDYSFHMYENGNSSSIADQWALEYKVNEEFVVYYAEDRAIAGNKANPFGLAYTGENFNVEYAQVSYDNKIGTDDSFSAFFVDYTFDMDQGGLYIKYTSREANAGQERDWNLEEGYSIFEPIMDDQGNTNDMYLKYDFNENMCFIFESSEPETGAGAEPELMTLGYQKEMKPGIDMAVAYTMLSDDKSVAAPAGATIDTMINNPLGNGNDVNVLRFEMKVKF